MCQRVHYSVISVVYRIWYPIKFIISCTCSNVICQNVIQSYVISSQMSYSVICYIQSYVRKLSLRKYTSFDCGTIWIYCLLSNVNLRKVCCHLFNVHASRLCHVFCFLSGVSCLLFFVWCFMPGVSFLVYYV